jgi:hypothetical protein
MSAMVSFSCKRTTNIFYSKRAHFSTPWGVGVSFSSIYRELQCTFWKVSDLVHLLYNGTIARTFQKVCLEKIDVTFHCREGPCEGFLISIHETRQNNNVYGSCSKRQHILHQENTFYTKRTHFIPREHILYQENTFYTKRIHSIRREHILQ